VTLIFKKILSLTNGQAQQERIVNSLIQSMIDLDIEKLEDIIDTYILSRGIERTINQLIFPFLEKIGILWLTNHVNPAQEHLVTNIIRQKLIVGIEGITTSLLVKKTFLLFLPESEYHELGLLFMSYILKSKGVSVIYAGANVPLKDVAYINNLKKPDYLYTHLTASHFNMEKFLNNVALKFGDTEMIISGLQAQAYQKKIPPKVQLKKSFAEVMEFVAGL
jgi:methanogenic corrinoid protein MtbC1